MTAMNHHRTQYHSPFTEVPLHGIEAHDLKFANAKPVRRVEVEGCTGTQNGGVRGYLSHSHTIHGIFTYIWLFS